MSAKTLVDCEKYFGTKNIYELFGVEKTASRQDVRKPFLRLLLQNHPDAASEVEKPEAIEKTKILNTLYNILKDPESRAAYDADGVISTEMEVAVDRTADVQMFCAPITAEFIDTYRQCYKGSLKERSDLKKAYLKGKGCMNYIKKAMEFMACEDEPRLIAIVQEMIVSKEVPEYETFTKEPKGKRIRRHAQYAREAAMAKQLLKDEQQGLDQDAYEQKIATERKAAFTAMIQSMEEKYRDAKEGPGIPIELLFEDDDED